jgi:hypothetical protein
VVHGIAELCAALPGAGWWLAAVRAVISDCSS